MDTNEAKVKIVTEICIAVTIIIGMIILLFLWYNVHPIEFVIKFETDNNTLELFKIMNMSMQNVTVVG